MTSFLHFIVSLALIWLFTSSVASLQSGLDLGGRRTRRQIHCREDTEYQHGSMCCSNCPAGTRLTSPCTAAGRKGSCEECDDGTFTEHSNHLQHCFKCTECRLDQELLKPCAHTHDTECQCKPGKFCAPDQPCEVCLTCSLCKKDEEVVRNCTPTSNTECKKIQSKPDSQADPISIFSIISMVAVVVIAGISGVFVWKYCKAREARRSLPDELKTEELNGDRPTEGTSTGGAQGLMCTSFLLSRPLEDEPELVPENGEESLRKSFEYFENVDIDYHKRFFRTLGIDDNVIKSKEVLPYEDRVHELLNIWLEKEGKDASLNVLLKALFDLNQRRTAETIKKKAIKEGLYHKK